MGFIQEVSGMLSSEAFTQCSNAHPRNPAAIVLSVHPAMVETVHRDGGLRSGSASGSTSTQRPVTELFSAAASVAVDSWFNE